MTVVVELKTYSREKVARQFAAMNGFEIIESFNNNSGILGKNKSQIKNKKDGNSYHLVFSSSHIYLTDLKSKIFVDFVEGELAHRRKFGGGKGQMLAKAVGLNKGYVPNVLDATAGLGGDAFVLAALGCTVTMIERSPIARLLLADGLRRAQEFIDLGDVDNDDLASIIQRMKLLQGDSLELLHVESLERLSIKKPDVIYLDPMFPERKKSAQVKKGMKAFHEVVGKDEDADKLLPKAIALAEHRVVVKRPKTAPYLNNQNPMYQLIGKSSRFDIYTIKAFPTS